MNDTRLETLLVLLSEKPAVGAMALPTMLAALSQLMRLPGTLDDQRTLLAAFLPHDCDRYFEGYLQSRIAKVRAFVNDNTMPEAKDGSEVLLIVTAIALAKSRKLFDRLRTGQDVRLSAWERCCYLPQLEKLATDNNPAQSLIAALIKDASEQTEKKRVWKLDFPDNDLGSKNCEDVARFCHRLGVGVWNCEKTQDDKLSLALTQSEGFTETSFLRFVTALSVHGRGCFAAYPVKELPAGTARSYETFEDRTVALRKASLISASSYDDPLSIFFQPLNVYFAHETELSLPCFSARLTHPAAKDVFKHFHTHEKLPVNDRPQKFVGQTDLTLSQAFEFFFAHAETACCRLPIVLQTVANLLEYGHAESFAAEFLLQILADMSGFDEHLQTETGLQHWLKSDCKDWGNAFNLLDLPCKTLASALILSKLRIQSEAVIRATKPADAFNQDKLKAIRSLFNTAQLPNAQDIARTAFRLLSDKGRIVRKITPIADASLTKLERLVHRVGAMITAPIDSTGARYLTTGLLTETGELRFMTALSAYLHGFVKVDAPKRLLDDGDIDFRYAYIGGFMQALQTKSEANIFNFAVEADPLVYYILSNRKLAEMQQADETKKVVLDTIFDSQPTSVADRQTAEFRKVYVKQQFEEIRQRTQAGIDKVNAMDSLSDL